MGVRVKTRVFCVEVESDCNLNRSLNCSGPLCLRV